MKKKIIIGIMVFVGLYLLSGFIADSLNPTAWGINGRVMFAIFLVYIEFMIAMFLD